MKRFAFVIGALVVLVGLGLYVRPRLAVQAGPVPQGGQASSGTALTPEALDRLFAPIALYPDQLLAQILLCAADPAGVKALDQFLKRNSSLKGTELQDAALKDNFEPQLRGDGPVSSSREHDGQRRSSRRHESVRRSRRTRRPCSRASSG